MDDEKWQETENEIRDMINSLNNDDSGDDEDGEEGCTGSFIIILLMLLSGIYLKKKTKKDIN